MINIFIRADASLTIGTGHIMRCLVLAREFKKFGSRVIFACRDAEGNMIDFIRNQGYEVFSISNTADTDAEILSLKRFIEDQKNAFDWLVVDNYGLNISWESQFKACVKHILVLDDLANRRHDCHMLVDCNDYEDAEDHYAPLVPKDCRILTGPRYALLRDEFETARKAMSRESRTPRRLLISFGGCDTENLTQTALEAVTTSGLGSLAIDVVIGKTNPWRDALKKACADLPNVRFLHDVTSMAALMAAADLSIGSGGITTWERCCLGLPTLAVIAGDNQLQCVRRLAGLGALEDLGWYDKLSLEELRAKFVEFVRSPERVKEMSRQAMALVDGLGRHRVINAMVNHSQPANGWHLRFDCIEDYIKAPEGFRFELIGRQHTESVVHWCNDPLNLDLFVSGRFDAKTQDAFLAGYGTKDRLDFILIQNNGSVPVGIFAIKNLSTRPEIGKLIGDHSFRGKGIGKAATIDLIRFAFDFLMLETIFARTQKTNALNIHLNERLGFKIIAEEQIEGKDYCLLSLPKEQFQCAAFSDR